jgi:hypothetical protein
MTLQVKKEKIIIDKDKLIDLISVYPVVDKLQWCYLVLPAYY